MIFRLSAAVIIVIAFLTTLFLIKVQSQNFLIKLDRNEQATHKETHAKPERIEGFQSPPQITSRSAIVIDVKTGIDLYQKDPNIRHLPASTTKLMTALVALEICDPQTVVTIEKPRKDGTRMGLSDGDKVTVENLLYGLLIASGNDAAYALANTCAKNYDDFIEKMNQKAASLEMTKTHFINPAGFDNDYQYSTARDLAKLAKVATTNPLINKIVNIKSTVVTDFTGTKTYYLENINKLLGNVEGLEGVKTGHTEGALEILISKTSRENNTIIAVVLGSHDRFNESKQLIEWTFKNFRWQTLD